VEEAYVHVYGAGKPEPKRADVFTARRTGADGRARLETMPPGEASGLVVFPPSGRLDLWPERIPDWTPADTTVRLRTALVVRGRVVDPGGAPVEGAGVYLGAGPTKKWAAYTDADGRFALGPFEPGSLDILARPRKGGRGSGVHHIRAGDEAVLLTVDPGLTLVVKAEGSPFAEVRFMAEGDRFQEGAFFHADGLQNGELAMPGFRPDAVLHLWLRAKTEDGWRAGWRPNVPVAAGEVTVRLVPVAPIAVRPVAPAGAEELRVWMVFGGRTATKPTDDGLYVFEGYPDAGLRAEATATVDGRTWSASAPVHPGDSITLTLRPED
jgi:hypothetical protein